MILVTGSEGLIGRNLVPLLRKHGMEVRPFDLIRSPVEDIRSEQSMRSLLHDVDGVIHLAAVSRVIWGERNPAGCLETNLIATKEILGECLRLRQRPWVIFSSSREVYGEPDHLPVQEDAPFNPLNVYARSKVGAELACVEARNAGLLVNVCRFSNVYGCPADHPDRVVPAFSRAAANGGSMRVEGMTHVFDFTHVADVVRGLNTLIQATVQGERMPPIHFVSGQGTTLGQLAITARTFAYKPVEIIEAPARRYDVVKFVGDVTRARSLLGWTSTINVESGIQELIQAIASTKEPRSG